MDEHETGNSKISSKSQFVATAIVVSVVSLIAGVAFYWVNWWNNSGYYLEWDNPALPLVPTKAADLLVRDGRSAAL